MAVFTSKDIGIAAITCAVPKNRISVNEYRSVFGDETVDRFISGTGIQSFHRSLPNQTASDLAAAAAQHLLQKTDIDPQKIGAMFLVTQSPDYRRPSSASVVQKRLGLPMDCACMELNLGCSGFIYGLQTAMSMMSQSDYEYALLLAADTATKLTDPADRSTAMMFSDAGAAVLLERRQGTVVKSLLRSDGSRFQAIMLPAGGFRDMNPGHERFVCSDGIERSLYDLFMDGSAVFSFAISEVPKALMDYLQITDTTVSDYDVFAFHQANQFIIKQLIRKAKLPKDKVAISLDRYGNAGSVSIPMTLCDTLGSANEGRKNVLMCGFGVGLSWGVMNAEINGENVFPIIETEDYYAEGKFAPGSY